MKIGVVIADDQALVRGGFRVLVDSASDMEVLGEAANGAEAVALARRHRPTVVLMDIRMPVVDGIQATAQITVDPATPDVRVLILTTFDLDEYVYAALRAGASGFMLKDTSPEELLAGIRIVAAGGWWVEDLPELRDAVRKAPPPAFARHGVWLDAAELESV